MSFKEKAIGSFFWSFAERFGQQGIQFIFSVALARILAPSDFGILGMLVIFVALSDVIVDSGFGQALVQKKELSTEDTSTVFWFGMVLGGVMTLAIIFAAPWIAAFYDQPVLVPLARLASLQIFVNGFSVVQRALLQRELLFKLRAKIILTAVVVSGVISIILAVKGFGVWSLAWLSVSYIMVMNAGIWLLHPWRPSLVFRTASFKELYSFGSRLFVAAVIDAVFINLLPVVIGKLYTPAKLGFYSRAQNLVKITSNSITGVLGQVNFPLLARMTHEPERMGRVFSKVLVFSAMVITPAMAGLMAASSEFIETLLGAKWLPCVPYLIPCCVIGIMFPIQYLNQSVLMALGRSDVYLKLEVAKKLIVVGCLALTVSKGVLVMVWGQAVAALAGVVLNTTCVGRFIGYGLLRQSRDLAGILLICAAMGLAVHWIPVSQVPLVARLPIKIAMGAASFGMLVLLYARSFKGSITGGLVQEGIAQIRGRIAR